jgi:hypothetical protein
MALGLGVETGVGRSPTSESCLRVREAGRVLWGVGFVTWVVGTEAEDAILSVGGPWIDSSSSSSSSTRVPRSALLDIREAVARLRPKLFRFSAKGVVPVFGIFAGTDAKALDKIRTKKQKQKSEASIRHSQEPAQYFRSND